MRGSLGLSVSLWLTGALAILFTVGVVSGGDAQPAKPDQAEKSNQAKGQSGDGPNKLPQDAGKPACLSPDQERELTDLRIKLNDLNEKQSDLQKSIQEKRDSARALEGKIARLDGAIKGTVILSDEEKDDAEGNLPAAKASFQKELTDINADIGKSIEQFKSNGFQLAETRSKVEALEKIKCPAPAATAKKTTEPEPPKTLPVKGADCKGSDDEKWLAEYKRLVAYYEQQNKDITVRLGEIDRFVKEANADSYADAQVKQVRLDEYGRQREDLNKRYVSNAEVIADFKAKIKAIVDKRPCPGTVKTSKPAGHPKAAERKKSQVVRHAKKPDAPAATPPVSISIGIGGFGGGRGFHGGREREQGRERPNDLR